MAGAAHVEAVTVQGDGITLSLLVWRRFRRPMPGLVEQILDLNRGLTSLGTVLPVGTVVMIPVPTDSTSQAPASRITLW